MFPWIPKSNDLSEFTSPRWCGQFFLVDSTSTVHFHSEASSQGASLKYHKALVANHVEWSAAPPGLPGYPEASKRKHFLPNKHPDVIEMMPTLCVFVYIYIYMICYDMLWYAMIWYDMLCYDMICYAMLWYDMIWYDMIWYAIIWYDMIWYAMLCYDMIWYDMIWYMMWCDVIWYEIW